MGTTAEGRRGIVPTFDGAMADLRLGTAFAVRLASRINTDGFPEENAWDLAPAIRFSADWQGKNADAQRSTEVRLLWNTDLLFVRFEARYRTLTVFEDADESGRRDQLWDRDVCEVFLQPPGALGRNYREFEVSPNGFWIDLDIVEGQKRDFESGLTRSVTIDKEMKSWRALLALPMNRIVERFDSGQVWRVNFYRVEGQQEPRFYSAWRPTRTPQPNFHVPEAFGALVFTEGASKIAR
jgi:alpha-galactosidase